MDFRITRTSDIFNNDKPCKDARMGCDDEGQQIFTISICNLKQLFDLIEEVQVPIILGTGKTIEIYDGYRE